MALEDDVAKTGKTATITLGIVHTERVRVFMAFSSGLGLVQTALWQVHAVFDDPTWARPGRVGGPLL
jgi:hypothetical protein